MAYVHRLERFWHSLISRQKLTLGTEVPGAVVACWPGIPSFRLNHAADIDVSEEDVEAILNVVTEYFLSRDIPSFGFRVSPLTRPKALVPTLLSQGFEMKDEDSVMVFGGARPKDTADSSVDVREIRETDIGVFGQTSVMAYEMPSEWNEGFNGLFLQRLRSGGRHYLAYVDGVPVGTCALLSSMKTGGVFSVGTLKEYRGRGIATAMTLRAVRDSFDDGNTLHTLQTEKGGYPERLYSRMGFEIDHAVAFFAKTVGE
jgi:GNAT superfamily N-acetyltransferase